MPAPSLDLGLPADRFLSDYWQQKPLLVRGAVSGWRLPVTADELAGLACEEEVASRIVRGPDEADDWHLSFGPFDPDHFAALPDRDWTLLVQDLDKLLPDVERLLDLFRFLPRWRIDDVMGSYAAAGGSVGPHWDHYDVFLIQAEGRRRWEIDTREAPVLRYRPDQELKLLQDFEASESWVLEPGDVLYLPPEVPHHGIAIEPCITLSVGMRAPSHAEMLVDFVETVAERLTEGERFADPRRTVSNHPARIEPEDVAQVVATLRTLLSWQDDRIANWFGRFITRYRLAGFPEGQDWQPGQVAELLRSGAVLEADPWSRWAFMESSDTAHLFVNGHCFETTPALARWLAGPKPLQTREAPTTSGTAELLLSLLSRGFLRPRAG